MTIKSAEEMKEIAIDRIIKESEREIGRRAETGHFYAVLKEEFAIPEVVNILTNKGYRIIDISYAGILISWDGANKK